MIFNLYICEENKCKKAMKQISIIFMMVLMSVISASAKDKTDDGRAEVMFYTTTHDFGYIKESKGPVTCVFEFENTGNAPLLIITASATCGCTRPEYPTKPIKPGKKGKIKVTFNPIGRPGPFRKNVKVKTNAKQKTVNLFVDGSVIPKEEEK